MTADEIAAFWDRQPCNVRYSDLAIGSREYFDQVERKRYTVGSYIPAFADFSAWRGKRVLDVGCGIGVDGVNFARAGALYHGIDVSAESVRIAQAHFAACDVPGTLRVLDAHELPSDLPLAWFDIVYAFGSIHHMLDQRGAMRAIRQMVRLDGELRIMLYAKHSWKALTVEAGLDRYEAQAGCPIVTLYDAAMLDELFDGLFTIRRVEQTFVFPWQVGPYKRGDLVLEPWFAAMPDAMRHAMERRLGQHLLIYAVPNMEIAGDALLDRRWIE